ncbi:U3 snoRNP protein [Tieghemostelium lacteum]|uniref:U3 snoRNP protein n=1 Tax=Tieghemostelium lacteum TaxID=361077 RepID=A0A152A732_TIELA|nr:U3 snoRNP protein [Tieghemostelium lacteum]|eukprot:KYR01857.1 U3 snoRNP protein [Tieghemostelium lacteum]
MTTITNQLTKSLSSGKFNEFFIEYLCEQINSNPRDYIDDRGNNLLDEDKEDEDEEDEEDEEVEEDVDINVGGITFTASVKFTYDFVGGAGVDISKSYLFDWTVTSKQTRNFYEEIFYHFEKPQYFISEPIISEYDKQKSFEYNVDKFYDEIFNIHEVLSLCDTIEPIIKVGKTTMDLKKRMSGYIYKTQKIFHIMVPLYYFQNNDIPDDLKPYEVDCEVLALIYERSLEKRTKKYRQNLTPLEEIEITYLSTEDGDSGGGRVSTKIPEGCWIYMVIGDKELYEPPKPTSTTTTSTTTQSNNKKQKAQTKK